MSINAIIGKIIWNNAYTEEFQERLGNSVTGKLGKDGENSIFKDAIYTAVETMTKIVYYCCEKMEVAPKVPYKGHPCEQKWWDTEYEETKSEKVGLLKVFGRISRFECLRRYLTAKKH